MANVCTPDIWVLIYPYKSKYCMYNVRILYTLSVKKIQMTFLLLLKNHLQYAICLILPPDFQFKCSFNFVKRVGLHVFLKLFGPYYTKQQLAAISFWWTLELHTLEHAVQRESEISNTFSSVSIVGFPYLVASFMELVFQNFWINYCPALQCDILVSKKCAWNHCWTSCVNYPLYQNTIFY